METTAARVLYAVTLLWILVFTTASAQDTCLVNVNCDISLDGINIDANHVVRTRLQNSVVRIWDSTADTYGTGTLINNLQCGNSHPEPYILTVWHVVGSALEGNRLDEVVFEFNYLPDSCGAVDPYPIVPPTTGVRRFTGASLVAGANRYEVFDGHLFGDFVLLRLLEDPFYRDSLYPDSIDIFYAGWTRNTSISSPVLTLGHSAGWPMKIAGDLHSPLKYGDNGFYETNMQYEWLLPSFEFGCHQAASSGSGFFTFNDIDCKLFSVLKTRHLGQIDAVGVRFDIGWDYTLYSCCQGMLGDANGVGGDEPTIGDLTAIQDSLFFSGAEIPCTHEADANSSGDISIADISALVDYLFITGTPLDSCSKSIPPLWPLPSTRHFIDLDGLDLDSLNGWAPGETYPNWSGCQ